MKLKALFLISMLIFTTFKGQFTILIAFLEDE